MEWYLMLIAIIGSLLVLMSTGMPVAYAFMFVNIVWGFFLLGGSAGIGQVILNIKDSVSTFTLLPLPLFLLMGEVIFYAGIAPKMLDALDNWLGRLPGRLGLLAVGGGVLFSTLTGSSAASVVMLGSTLVPEMEKRGYNKSMTLGPILGSGGLAMMIPPSSIAVLLAAIGEISVGDLLMAIIMPGLLMAVLYAIYIIFRSYLQPSIAPPYDVPGVSLSEKISATARYVLPVGFIIFLVIGIIFLGVATPTEAAATGALGTFILAAAYKRLNWDTVKKSLRSTVVATCMVMFIIAGAVAFANILAYSGAGMELSKFAAGLPVAPIIIIIAFVMVSLFLGMFMGPSAIIMITLPIFMPVVRALGFNDVWFGAIYMLSIEMGQTTPPYGMAIFAMVGVAPQASVTDCYKAAVPYLVMDGVAIVLMMVFPIITLWIPGLMG